MTAASDLARLQHAMLAAIAKREPAEAGTRFAKPSSRQTGAERIAVYAGSYSARLVELLRSDYPALRVALGEELFDAFALKYLRSSPSRSWNLATFGAGFADHLEASRPDRRRPRRTPGWIDLLCDLGTFERAIAEVFDGPGSEGGPTLRPDMLASPGQGLEGGVRLRTTPSLKLLALRFPIDAWYRALRRVDLEDEQPGSPPPAPAAKPSFVALVRRDFMVERHPISRAQYELLAALQSGKTLAAAILAAAPAVESDEKDLAANLAKWFSEWGALGIFEAAVATGTPARSPRRARRSRAASADERRTRPRGLPRGRPRFAAR